MGKVIEKKGVLLGVLGLVGIFIVFHANDQGNRVVVEGRLNRQGIELGKTHRLFLHNCAPQCDSCFGLVAELVYRHYFHVLPVGQNVKGLTKLALD